MSSTTLDIDNVEVAPFDTVAPQYDARFSNHRLGRWLRARVWKYLDNAFRAGDHVIDLGCGTGEDAVHLARRGVEVTAIDVSSGMLAVAERKTALEGVSSSVHLSSGSFDDLVDVVPDGRTFDGAYSNFGVLNCTADRHRLAADLAGQIRPGGTLVIVMMSPLCPWEWAWYLTRGQVRTAVRRLGETTTADLDSGATMNVWYPSPQRVRREFSDHFRVVRTAGIGVLLPPTFATGLVDRWPRFFGSLARADGLAGSVFPGTWLNDHFLMVFERTEAVV